MSFELTLEIDTPTALFYYALLMRAPTPHIKSPRHAASNSLTSLATHASPSPAAPFISHASSRWVTPPRDDDIDASFLSRIYWYAISLHFREQIHCLMVALRALLHVSSGRSCKGLPLSGPWATKWRLRAYIFIFTYWAVWVTAC